VKRSATCLLTIGLALAILASGQAAPPATEPGNEPAPAVDQAMVRIVHVAPNAELERVVLVDAASGERHEFGDLRYLSATEYVPVFPGPYDLAIDLAPVDDAHAAHVVETRTIDTVTGSFYTIVLMGLVLPPEAVAAEDGFLAWLEELFTAERRDLTLFPLVLDDLAYIALGPIETEVRLVHAAPGTDAIDLVMVSPAAADRVLRTAAYGNASAYTRIFPADGTLQIRMAGTEAVVADLSEMDVGPNMVHTVILTGTPIDDVPLRAMIVSSTVFDPIARPTAPGVPAPAWGHVPPAQAAWANDRLFQAQVWLESAEARLSNELTAIEGAQEQASAAMREVHAARAALEQVRALLQAFAAPAGTPPGAPSVEPEDPAEPDEVD
jgi:hypothetical protein